MTLNVIVAISICIFIISNSEIQVAHVPVSLQPYESKFKKWIKEYGNSCCTNEKEYVYRLSVFAQNDDLITTHNKGNQTWRMGHNSLSYLTQHEIASRMCYIPIKHPIAGVSVHHAPPNGTVLPDSVDWVSKGVVSPVKNQGRCGSCWSFSTTGALEGAFAIKNGKLPSAQGFSEQMLIDCDRDKNSGCNGGRQDWAFKWIQSNGGLCTEESYPYKGQDGKCQKSCTPVKGSADTSYTTVEHYVATALMSAVAQQPVAVAVNGGPFSFYHSGVITSNCPSELSHAVLVVGYDVDPSIDCDVPPKKGCPYWKIKDSYGTNHALEGYVRIQRQGWPTQWGGMCGVLMDPLYPNL